MLAHYRFWVGLGVLFALQNAPCLAAKLSDDADLPIHRIPDAFFYSEDTQESHDKVVGRGDAPYDSLKEILENGQHHWNYIRPEISAEIIPEPPSFDSRTMFVLCGINSMTIFYDVSDQDTDYANLPKEYVPLNIAWSEKNRKDVDQGSKYLLKPEIVESNTLQTRKAFGSYFSPDATLKRASTKLVTVTKKIPCASILRKNSAHSTNINTK